MRWFLTIFLSFIISSAVAQVPNPPSSSFQQPVQTYTQTVNPLTGLFSFQSPGFSVSKTGTVIQASGQGFINALAYGAKGDGVTDDSAAINNAIAAAASLNLCVYLPATPNGYFISAPIQGPVGSGTASTEVGCLQGDPPTLSSSNLINGHYQSQYSGTWLHTMDTDCLIATGSTPSYFRDIGCAGNAQTSTSATKTVGFLFTKQYTVYSDHLAGTGYVTCMEVDGATNFPVLANVDCDEKAQYPNLVNNYPQFCVDFENVNGTVEAAYITGLNCRGSAVSQTSNFTGDGTTTFFDIALPSVSGTVSKPVMWAADELNLFLANVPQTLGSAYTLFDCGSAACGGTGGTAIFGQTVTASVTSGSANVTITSGSTSAWPSILSPSQLKVFSPSLLPADDYVVSITDGTHFVMSQNALSTGSVTMTVAQVNVGSISGSTACSNTNPPTCGHNLEVRFASAPANGVAIKAIWAPTWYDVVINDGSGGQNIIQATGIDGGRIGFKHISGYGMDRVSSSYVELLNYCMSVEGGLTGDTVSMGRAVGPVFPNGTNDSCNHWISPSAINTRLIWNGSPWTKVNLLGNAASYTWGSATAPLNQSTGVIHEFKFDKAQCSIGGQILATVSEDGTTFLAGTNYVYHETALASSATTYAAVASAGTASFPLTGGQNFVDADGTLQLFEVGNAVDHSVISDFSGRVAAVAFAARGGGMITGTPAALSAINFACSGGGNMTGTLYHRIVY